MRRIELIELHDHPRCPGYLRDLVTDALQALWQFGNSYGPILPHLYSSLAATSTTIPTEVLDLCSGGGGPWLPLSRQLERDYCFPVRVYLTDKYPNPNVFERSRIQAHTLVDSRASTNPHAQLDFASHPVDATHVPGTLDGFRTIFSSFHHFGPADARKILHSAVTGNRGIGIFEVAHRSPKTLLILCFTPFLVLLLTPHIRPFRWFRLLWTYLVPVVPFVIWFDGLVSCLRAYAPEELNEMLQEMAQVSSQPYRWQVGEERNGLLPVTYLIGYPAIAQPLRQNEATIQN